jgi:murein DD-endopeptidase MepM/ murein hydrolase activator NlpD
VLTAALVVLGVLSHAPSHDVQSGLAVSHRARRVAPGEIVLVRVSATDPLQQVTGTWLGRQLVFYRLDPRRWHALAPIDLDTRPGRYTLVASATTVRGHVLDRDYVLSIVPRTFATRRLTVASEFAEPPANLLPRLEQERAAIDAIFSAPPGDRLWAGAFVPPVPGAASSSFGRRSIINGQPRGPHLGADLQAAEGTAVAAPNRGRVALVADHYFAGRLVILDHGGGVYSYLAHLSEVLVAEGDMVERGQVVARSGATGRVTGPHLHWAARVNGARVDPLSLVAVARDPGQPARRSSSDLR